MDTIKRYGQISGFCPERIGSEKNAKIQT